MINILSIGISSREGFWKQPKYPWDMIDKMLYIDTMECSAKMNKILICPYNYIECIKILYLFYVVILMLGIIYYHFILFPIATILLPISVLFSCLPVGCELFLEFPFYVSIVDFKKIMVFFRLTYLCIAFLMVCENIICIHTHTHVTSVCWCYHFQQVSVLLDSSFLVL